MYIAIDIGGTKTLLAVFDENGVLTEQVKFPTPPIYDDFLTTLKANFANLTTQQFISGGIGIRGNIDREKGMSLLDDVLAWGEATVRDDCEAIFGCKFALENDSKLAGLSEAILLKDQYRKVLYITISTGLGTSFIVGGKLDENTINSEVGKSLFEHEGKLQQWEDFASGKAIVAKYNQRASDIQDPVIWREIAGTLAFGLIDVAAAFTPDVIVFGGGVGAHFDKFQAPLTEIITEIKPVEINFPPMQVAARPEEAVIYGCLEIAQQIAHGDA